MTAIVNHPISKKEKALVVNIVLRYIRQLTNSQLLIIKEAVENEIERRL